jgi:hypothetical protein
LSLLLGRLLLSLFFSGLAEDLALFPAGLWVIVFVAWNTCGTGCELTVTDATGVRAKVGILVKATRVLGNLAESPCTDALDLVADLDVGQSVCFNKVLVLKVVRRLSVNL